MYGQPLVIPKVATYSMELRDGRIIIWALGAAAWYAISPAKEYRAVFEMLVEKAQLWLFLEERYSRHHGGGKIIKGDVLEVCKDVGPLIFLLTLWRANTGMQFVEESNGSCRTARTAARLFDKHHRYLLLMMFKPGADFEMWKRTPIFAHYLREFEVGGGVDGGGFLGGC